MDWPTIYPSDFTSTCVLVRCIRYIALPRVQLPPSQTHLQYGATSGTAHKLRISGAVLYAAQSANVPDGPTMPVDFEMYARSGSHTRFFSANNQLIVHNGPNGWYNAQARDSEAFRHQSIGDKHTVSRPRPNSCEAP